MASARRGAEPKKPMFEPDASEKYLFDCGSIIPDEVPGMYLNKAGLDSCDPRVMRLLAMSTQKFIADILVAAMQHQRLRLASTPAQEPDAAPGAHGVGTPNEEAEHLDNNEAEAAGGADAEADADSQADREAEAVSSTGAEEAANTVKAEPGAEEAEMEEEETPYEYNHFLFMEDLRAGLSTVGVEITLPDMYF